MEGLVFGLAQNLLEILASNIYEELHMVCGVERQVRILKENVLAIQAVISDREERQIKDKQQAAGLTIWLKDLEDLIYDAEDVFEGFQYEALRRQVVKMGKRKVNVFRFFSDKFNSVSFSFKMAHKMKDITVRFDEISVKKDSLDLTRTRPSNLNSQDSMRISESNVKFSEVIGRDNEREEIINSLLHSNDNKNLSIISLVGFGGLGKTTLAKLVYNDKRIDEEFEEKIWICVSDDFDVKRLTKEILSYIGVNKNDIEGLITKDLLLTKLRKTLENKKFILVLDDIWDEVNLEKKWEGLRLSLETGASGSKIIVTTRFHSVAKMMDECNKIELKGLSEIDSWSLFVKCAFEDGKADQYPKLKVIGEQVIKKCKGVPLAIVSLGRLLHSLGTDMREWEKMRDSEIWQLEEKHTDILPALRLSYELMPSYLKPCFIYCANFPQDYEFISIRIIYMWMAQGMVHSEDQGKRYLKELSSRCFLIVESLLSAQNSLSGDMTSYRMHDIIRELAIKLAKGKCFRIKKIGSEEIPENVQHLSCSDKCDKILRQANPSNKVRSAIFDEYANNVDDMMKECITKFEFLRVLGFGSSLAYQIPSSISRLKHLKYLDLTNNGGIKILPKSMFDLYSLQTLMLAGCENLEEIPRDIRKLINLRNLEITTKQTTLPENGIGCLINLRRLFLFGCDSLKSLFEDIKNLTDLTTLYIIWCPSLEPLPDGINVDPVIIPLPQ